MWGEVHGGTRHGWVGAAGGVRGRMAGVHEGGQCGGAVGQSATRWRSGATL